MQYAALVRPAIDRVYVGVRAAAGGRCRRVAEQIGLRPGFILSFYFGLLARPMPAAAFTAVTTYSGSDMTGELEQGIAVVDDAGTWELTPSGRALAMAVQQAIADGAQEHWSRTSIATLPGLTALPRLAELLNQLLWAGVATGGPAFAAMAPVYEPEDASPSLLVTSRLGALRHHRADAHRAAWAAAGLTLPELLTMPDGPRRQAIEAETNRLDAPIYQVLSEQEQWEFLGILAALPG